MLLFAGLVVPHAEINTNISSNHSVTGFKKQLSVEDEYFYRRVWRLYSEGAFADAEHLRQQIDNPVLFGRLDYIKLMHRDTRSSYGELARFMRHYRDHALSHKVYRLASVRKSGNKGASTVEAKLSRHSIPRVPFEAMQDLLSVEEQDYFQNFAKRNGAYMQRNPSATLSYGFRADRATRKVAAKLRTYLLDGEYDRALGFYLDNTTVSERKRRPEILWWGGLAAFQLGDIEVARDAFAALGRILEAKNSSDPNLAMVHFWLARCHIRQREAAEAKASLMEAKKYSLNYYGVVAGAMLGEEIFGASKRGDDIWRGIDLPDALFDSGTVKRVLALVEIDQHVMADLELANFIDKRKMMPANALLLVSALADSLKLPMAAYDAADKLYREHGWFYARGMFPIPWWFGASHFAVENMLSLQLLSMARRESRFEPTLRSAKGAEGVLQIMPATALFIERNSKREGNESKAQGIEYNLDLARRYFSYLLSEDVLDGDLLSAVAAYNAGPGAFKHWSHLNDLEDPLMFLETIPFRETRNYLNHVLHNTFVYSSRMQSENKVLVRRFVEGAFPNIIDFKGEGSGDIVFVGYK